MEPEAMASSSSSHIVNSHFSPSKSDPFVTTEETFQLEALFTTPNTRSQSWLVKRLNGPIASRFPALHHQASRAVHYIKGPRPKVDLRDPKPFFNFNFNWRGHNYDLALESAWIRLTRPLTSPSLLLIFGAGYIIAFAFLSRASSFLTPASSFLDCNSAYWAANDACGLDGTECGPFDSSTFDFRCPAQCSSVVLANPRTVGNEQMVNAPLIVGGGDENGTYRGDSFICAAAVQAGVISESKGGCASLQLIGNFTNYLPKTANGLSSIAFPSVFPLSFQFLPSSSLTHCTDLRDSALAFNVLVTCALFFVLRPKPITLFWSLVCIGFWHISLFSQPRAYPPLLDEAFATFLPTLFVAYGFWRMAFRFTLPAFTNAPVEAALWYLTPFWATVLSNITFFKLPIDRLIASDLTKRPGAVTALVIIVIVVFIIVVNQVRVVRKTGWLPYYLTWYTIGGLVALVIALLPGLQFRLHHYIVAMVLMPITAFPTRLSAIYQGFLLGLFLNGVAAFGFASILETAADLQRDGPSGSALPTILTNSTTYNTSIPLAGQIIQWDVLSDGWAGFTLLVDDVERYTGTAFNYSLASLQVGIPHFFRLAFTGGGISGDFTMPATLWPNGTWVDPLPGPS